MDNVNANGNANAAAAVASNGNISSAMKLRDHEVDRARTIKLAVDKDERLRPLSDFEYVQWALTLNSDAPMEEICQRVYMMQCFKEAYALEDTVEEAAHILTQFSIQMQPGALLSFDYLPASQNYCLVNDVAHFFPARIQTDEDFRIYLGFNFYMFQAGFPTFAAQRAGLTVILECMDATIEDNFDHRQQERFMEEFMMYYPKRDKEYYFINSPMVSSRDILVQFWQCTCAMLMLIHCAFT